MKNPVDLTGRTFGMLTALSLEPRTSRTKRYRWRCKCKCGREVSILACNLTTGHTTACGCRNGESHGLRRTPEYAIWRTMKTRCENQSNASYVYYGARGIQVCERWKSFSNFWADMGPRPSSRHSLDRIDVNGNYEPGNVRWATWAQQAVNKRGSHRHLDMRDERDRMRLLLTDCLAVADRLAGKAGDKDAIDQLSAIRSLMEEGSKPFRPKPGD